MPRSRSSDTVSEISNSNPTSENSSTGANTATRENSGAAENAGTSANSGTSANPDTSADVGTGANLDDSGNFNVSPDSSFCIIPVPVEDFCASENTGTSANPGTSAGAGANVNTSNTSTDAILNTSSIDSSFCIISAPDEDKNLDSSIESSFCIIPVPVENFRTSENSDTSLTFDATANSGASAKPGTSADAATGTNLDPAENLGASASFGTGANPGTNANSDTGANAGAGADAGAGANLNANAVNDQHNSITHVDPIRDMYNLPDPRIPEGLLLPFRILDGEAVNHHGNTADGLIVLTNYRLYLEAGENHHHLPIGLIENVEIKDLFYLHIWCKDARTYRCTFSNTENCQMWFERMTKAIERTAIVQIFAFYNYIWTKENQGENFASKSNQMKNYTFDHALFKKEMDRLQFQGDSWRISEANKNYKLCPTYPPYLIVPSCINDETLEAVAKFRSSRRIPAVVWRHTKNGAVIARCSQPEVGWLGWRSSEDEELLKAISQACSFDPRNDKETMLSHSPGSLHSEDSLQFTGDIGTKEKKVLIMDARSYTTAVANRARGGGVECPEYYPNCDISFMNLANIHSIRKSFHGLRLLCTGTADALNWYSQLENTRWMHHMSVLMKAAVTLVTAVEREGRPVLVHCSDGWDRTPQIVALSEIMLDPYYRTMEGFRILIEREWLAFGHKFADRCGHAANVDHNELCPVFLQWLDCVHQLLLQFDCAFEFTQSYLVKLAQHVYSNLYGTFLSNTFQERMRQVSNETFSVWEFLGSPRFKNHLYALPGTTYGYKVLWPQVNIRDLHLWREVYLGSWEANFSSESGSGSGSCPGPPDSSPSHMTKTRSYGDLLNAADACALPSTHQFRRSSDPSINIDKKLVNGNAAPTPPQDIVNGHLPPSGGDFLAHETDDVECKPDCLFKDDRGDERAESAEDSATAAASSDRDGVFSLSVRVVIQNGDKTDSDEVGEACSCDGPAPSTSSSRCCDGDSDNELTEKSESKSENTVCELGATERLETSTDTLVSDSHNISSSPLDSNGFEKLQRPTEDVDIIDGRFNKLSAQNLRLVNEALAGRRSQMSNYNHYNNGSSNNNNYSPTRSRASSTCGWDNGLSHPQSWNHQGPRSHRLGDDGLTLVTSEAQERLLQMIQDHKRKEDRLAKELHDCRQALLKNACHKCNNNDSEKPDDAN